jgi:hypothetical protein
MEPVSELDDVNVGVFGGVSDPVTVPLPVTVGVVLRDVDFVLVGGGVRVGVGVCVWDVL